MSLDWKQNFWAFGDQQRVLGYVVFKLPGITQAHWKATSPSSWQHCHLGFHGSFTERPPGYWHYHIKQGLGIHGWCNHYTDSFSQWAPPRDTITFPLEVSSRQNLRISEKRSKTCMGVWSSVWLLAHMPTMLWKNLFNYPSASKWALPSTVHCQRKHI